MSTYEELQIILTFALLVVAILNLKIRNSAPALTKYGAISYSPIFVGNG